MSDKMREFVAEVKQLCKDFSDQRDRPYMGDVHAALDGLYEQWQAAQSAAVPVLSVWYGEMPESNGKSNWTALLCRDGDVGSGITIERSEYPDRVRYEADRVRFLIGEINEEPCVLDYDAEKHSGYVKAETAAVPVVRDVVAYAPNWAVAKLTGEMGTKPDYGVHAALYVADERGPVAGCTPLIIQPTTSITAAELERLQQCEDVLRSLACSLAVGGYIAVHVNPAAFEKKIRAGIDMLLAPLTDELDALREKGAQVDVLRKALQSIADMDMPVDIVDVMSCLERETACIASAAIDAAIAGEKKAAATYAGPSSTACDDQLSAGVGEEI